MARLQAILQWNFGATATETLDSLASWESEIEELGAAHRGKDGGFHQAVRIGRSGTQGAQYLPAFAHQGRGDLCHSEAQDPGLSSGDGSIRPGSDGSGFRREEGQRRAKASSNSPRVAASRTRAKTSTCRTRTNPRLMKERAMGNQSKVSSPPASFRDIAATAASGTHPQRECWEKSINNLADSTSASSSSRVDTYNSSSEHGTGAGQSGFAGNLWEQNEVNNKRWLFSVGMAGWPSGLQGRPGQWCTILIDSGSSATVCGPQHLSGISDSAK